MQLMDDLDRRQLAVAGDELEDARLAPRGGTELGGRRVSPWERPHGRLDQAAAPVGFYPNDPKRHGVAAGCARIR